MITVRVEKDGDIEKVLGKRIDGDVAVVAVASQTEGEPIRSDNIEQEVGISGSCRPALLFEVMETLIRTLAEELPHLDSEEVAEIILEGIQERNQAIKEIQEDYDTMKEEIERLRKELADKYGEEFADELDEKIEKASEDNMSLHEVMSLVNPLIEKYSEEDEE